MSWFLQTAVLQPAHINKTKINIKMSPAVVTLSVGFKYDPYFSSI